MDRDATPNAHQARRRKHDPADSDAHAHRRADDDDDMARMHVRLNDLAGMVGGNTRDINRIDATLATLIDSMQGLTDNTGRLADVLEAWNNAKGFLITLRVLMSALKAILPIAVFLGALWIFLKTGRWIRNEDLF